MYASFFANVFFLGMAFHRNHLIGRLLAKGVYKCDTQDRYQAMTAISLFDKTCYVLLTKTRN